MRCQETSGQQFLFLTFIAIQLFSLSQVLRLSLPGTRNLYSNGPFE